MNTCLERNGFLKGRGKLNIVLKLCGLIISSTIGSALTYFAIMSHTHTTHPDIINRLKRANGHVAKIISMIEEERPCAEVAQQMQSVCSAFLNAKKIFVQDHIEGCIEIEENQTQEDIKKKVKELKEMTKYLSN